MSNHKGSAMGNHKEHKEHKEFALRATERRFVREGEAHGSFRPSARRGLPRAFVFFVFFVVAQSCVAFSASALSFRWRTEVSSAAPYEAQAMQGESFALEATLVQYGAPLTGEATATFYYQTKQMASTEWFSAPAAWDEATATASVTWSPALDVGQSAYRWFFGIDTAQGHNYRAYGTLRLKPSPGFSPALLEPIDLREQLKAELYAQLQADLSAAFAADLQAETKAREAADGAITEAVNAQAGVLEQHQGYLYTLSGNYNALYSSYTNTVSELQATDASHESALAAKAALEHTHAIADTEGLQTALDAKADASALSAHAATWATGSAGGHVKLGTNSILSTADGNFGVVGKTSSNQLIYRIDATPTAGSSLPVKSGGIYTALAAKAEATHTHSQYLTAESDPTVSAWAKAATKPTYTWTEILNRPTTWDWANLTGVPTTFTPAEHTHSQYITTESDPTVSAWAKATAKPTYTWTEILNRPTTWDWEDLTGVPTAFTPAEHNHDGTYLKLSGGTVTGNVTFSGSSNYMEKLEFGGSALAAGLMTRGISGRAFSNLPGAAKDALFLNYDGSLIPHNTYWNYGTEGNNTRGVFVCGGAPDGLVVRRIDLETILKDYSPAAHTHTIADTTGLQAALEALAPLSSVTCTTNNVTYIWQWDEAAGTFALVER